MSTVAYHAWWPVPQRRAALRGAATVTDEAGAAAIERASTKGCSQRSSDPTRQPREAGTPCRLNEGLLSEEQRLTAGPHARWWKFGPQRRAALRGAATRDSLYVRDTVAPASTKGCSQRSSDVRGARVPAQPHSASTKGCSQRSSDLVAGLLELHVDDGLNEGLLSEEQRHGLSKSLTGTSTEPQRRAALRGAATQTCSKAERLCPASTKGCSQRSSDPRRWADPKVSCQSLNEGLLSEEQRRRAPVRNKLGHQRPQRRAALRGAATNKNGIRDAVKGSLNEGLLSEEQRLDRARLLSPSGMPQRRAALRGAATVAPRRSQTHAVTGLNEGLLSEEQRHRRRE